ncbi:MAG: phage holin family protein [Micromonosporaceae bacterium]|nr:phage holin family protein [Micromonosporaceae bacterium]
MAQPRTESAPELVKRATEQISTLVRDEMALARNELGSKIGHAGKGAGLFGGAGLVALFGAASLLAGLVMLVGRAIGTWASALVFGGALLILAGVLALGGRGEVRRAVPPVPTEAAKDIKADLAAVGEAARDHRRQ